MQYHLQSVGIVIALKISLAFGTRHYKQALKTKDEINQSYSDDVVIEVF